MFRHHCHSISETGDYDLLALSVLCLNFKNKVIHDFFKIIPSETYTVNRLFSAWLKFSQRCVGRFSFYGM